MTSVLLINEPPLQVLPSLASCIGLNEALILQQVHYWIQPARNRNVFDNRCWVYNTYEQWKGQFPFWSKSTISRTILNLESMGVLLSRESGGRIKYYTIDYDKLEKINETQNESIQNASIQNEVTIDSKCIDASMQNESMVDSNCIDVYIDTETTQRLPSERERGTLEPTLFQTGFRDLPFGESPPSSKKEFKSSLEKDKKEKGTLLPVGWVLAEESRAWSIKRGMSDETIDMEVEKFESYWRSAIKHEYKRNWQYAWRTWCLRIKDYNQGVAASRNYAPIASGVPVQSTEVPREVPQVKNVIKQSDNPKIQQWHDLQPQLKERVGTAVYNSWLMDLELVSFDEKAVFKARNAFLADQIYNRFVNDIAAILAKIDPNLGVEIDIKAVI